MLKNNSLLVTFILTLFITVSCKKENTNELNQAPKPLKMQMADPSNSLNPLDYTGFYHNEGLDYIQPIKDNWTCAESFPSFLQGPASTYLCNSSLPEVPYLENCSTFANSVSSDLIEIIDMSLDESLDHFNESIAVRNSIHSLVQIIENANETDDPTILINAIKSWESGLTTANLTNDELENMLVAGSVARYSFSYWYNEYQNNFTNWSDPCEVSRSFGINWGKVLCVTITDIKGAYDGYKIGKFFGPKGKIAGVVIGGVIGSAYGAIKKCK